MADYIKKLLFKFDIEKLNSALTTFLDEKLDWDKVKSGPGPHSTNFTHRPNAKDKWLDGAGIGHGVYGPKSLYEKLHDDKIYEDDFTEFNDELKDTYFYEIYEKLSTAYKIGRVRLIKTPAKTIGPCWHVDPEERIQIPIVTNLGERYIIMDKCYFLPANGCAYITNTTLPHSTFNGGFIDRYAMIFHIVDYKDPTAITNLNPATRRQDIINSQFASDVSYDNFGVMEDEG